MLIVLLLRLLSTLRSCQSLIPRTPPSAAFPGQEVFLLAFTYHHYADESQMPPPPTFSLTRFLCLIAETLWPYAAFSPFSAAASCSKIFQIFSRQLAAALFLPRGRQCRYKPRYKCLINTFTPTLLFTRSARRDTIFHSGWAADLLHQVCRHRTATRISFAASHRRRAAWTYAAGVMGKRL